MISAKELLKKGQSVEDITAAFQKELEEAQKSLASEEEAKYRMEGSADAVVAAIRAYYENLNNMNGFNINIGESYYTSLKKALVEPLHTKKIPTPSFPTFFPNNLFY